MFMNKNEIICSDCNGNLYIDKIKTIIDNDGKDITFKYKSICEKCNIEKKIKDQLYDINTILIIDLKNKLFFFNINFELEDYLDYYKRLYNISKKDFKLIKDYLERISKNDECYLLEFNLQHYQLRNSSSINNISETYYEKFIQSTKSGVSDFISIIHYYDI